MARSVANVKRNGFNPARKNMDTQKTDAWFRNVSQQLQVVTGTGAPTISNLPEGCWMVYYNTSDGTTKLYAHRTGFLCSVALT